MAIRLVVTLEAFPGNRDAMFSAYQKRCPSVREQPGCIEFELFQNIENPDQFVLVEGWADDQALAVHVASSRGPGVDPFSLRRQVRAERYEYVPSSS